MAQLWKGAPVAAALTKALTSRCHALKAAGVAPTLAIVRLGQRPDDISYETAAIKRCKKIGVAVKQFLLPQACSRAELTAIIEHINVDPAIHGCLVLRPLPDREMEELACAKLAPEKDVDGMTAAALTTVFTGSGAGYPPCTAQACVELLDHYGVDLTGKQVAVIGRSLVIGKPVSMLLQAKNATVTMCHTKTADLPSVCRNADIVVAAAGRAGLVTADCAAPGQILLDVGISVDADGRLRGDVDFGSVESVVSAITPVPGGVGSVTTTVLCRHVIQAAEKAAK